MVVPRAEVAGQRSAAATIPADSATGSTSGPSRPGEHERPADQGEVARRETRSRRRACEIETDVGEVREDERQQRHGEHSEHPAEDEMPPRAGAEREDGERQECERGD